MLRADMERVLFMVAIVNLSIYSGICLPVMKGSEVMAATKTVYSLNWLQQKLIRTKRNTSHGPDLGYGNRRRAGNIVAQLQLKIHDLTGPHSPGKRSAA